MPNLIPLTDFSAPELDVYARLTEVQLLNRFEPEKGLFIAESPKVIERALNAGCTPVSILVEDKHVEVLRSVSLPQGISAMLAFNPDGEVEENVSAMKEAMAAVSSLSMTFAAHDSTFDNREIKENQILGLVENKVRYVTDSREECMANLCDDIKEAYYIRFPI